MNTTLIIGKIQGTAGSCRLWVRTAGKYKVTDRAGRQVFVASPAGTRRQVGNMLVHVVCLSIPAGGSAFGLYGEDWKDLRITPEMIATQRRLLISREKELRGAPSFNPCSAYFATPTPNYSLDAYDRGLAGA